MLQKAGRRRRYVTPSFENLLIIKNPAQKAGFFIRFRST